MSASKSCKKIGAYILLVYILLFVLNLFMNGIYSVFVLACAALFGFFAFKTFIKRRHELPSVFADRFNGKLNLFVINESGSGITICLICGDVCCERHDAQESLDPHPWKGVTIDRRVDDALEEILSLTLKEHIYSWHDEIGADQAHRFDLEIRNIFRCLAAAVLRRVNKVNANELVLKKVIKVLLHHLEVFIHGKRKAKTAQHLEEAVLKEYGNMLHPALLSRDDEIKYLRSLVESILPRLLPPKYLSNKLVHSFFRELLSCSILLPLIDIAADPDMVNVLIALLFDKEPITQYDNIKVEQVEILERFISCKQTLAVNADNNVLGIELKQILSDQQLLFLFTQFAKEEGFVHLVQFLLHIDAFSQKTLNPDLTHQQLQELHAETCKIFNSYFQPNSVDHITFSQEIIDDIREIVHGSVEGVEKLRTTAALYRAYEHVYNLLENHYCALFMQSDLYFKLICGQRTSSFEYVPKKKLTMSKSKSQLSFTDSGEQTLRNDETLSGYSNSNNENSERFNPSNEYSIQNDDRLRDLSSWRVSISSVENRLDVNAREFYVYVIDVKRLDSFDKGVESLESSWDVERRYNEFYVLDGKLREFHGEKLNDISLPPKRILKSNKPFLEAKRVDFENYLKKLLTCSLLKGSELVYNFLTSNSDEFTTGFLPDIKLGKMIKTMPSKLLIKERGQHLDGFLYSFIISTEQSRPKPSKDEIAQILDNSPVEFATSNLANNIYGDNISQWKSNDDSEDIDVNMKVNESASCNNERAQAHLEYVFDFLLFLALRLYSLPQWILKVMMMMRPLLRKTLQSYCEWYFDFKMKTTLLVAQRVVDVIHLLRDALYHEKDLPVRTKHQRQQRMQKALKNATEFFPEWLIRDVLGKEKHEEVIFKIFSLCQSPLLNKQLCYILVDIAVKELFPEVLSTNNSYCDFN